jgi:hypothetical protein
VYWLHSTSLHYTVRLPHHPRPPPQSPANRSPARAPCTHRRAPPASCALTPLCSSNRDGQHFVPRERLFRLTPAVPRPVAPRHPLQPTTAAQSAPPSSSWHARRQSHAAGQAPAVRPLIVPFLISSSPFAACTSAVNLSPWPRLLCHDTRRHSRSLAASAHRSTSAASPPMPAPSSSCPTQSSRSPCEAPTQLPRSPHQLARGQCLSKRIPPAAADRCLTCGRSPSVRCQHSRSTRPAQHHQPPARHHHNRLQISPQPPRSQFQEVTGEVAANSSAGTRELAACRF